MTKIRVQALKALVLLVGFLLLTSVLPSARAAGHSATPECAMPAEGCVTGLGADMFTTMDVSYCEHDPGHCPLYATDYNWPTTADANPCAPGEVFNIHCIEPLDAAWVSMLTDLDKTYRQDVCACWAQHPGDGADDTAARDACIDEAGQKYIRDRNAYQKAWKKNAAECCGAYPRPVFIINGEVISVPDVVSKRLIPIANN